MDWTFDFAVQNSGGHEFCLFVFRGALILLVCCQGGLKNAVRQSGGLFSDPLKSPIHPQIYRLSPKMLHGTQGDSYDGWAYIPPVVKIGMSQMDAYLEKS